MSETETREKSAADKLRLLADIERRWMEGTAIFDSSFP
jgi:hypothetical protein